jgi:broad specificity phosphatase PhoE
VSGDERPLHLLRHADAGDRTRWTGDDAERPLSEKGRRQAEAIALRLGSRPLGRLVSSPARRCVETLAPLAAATGLEVECDPRLAEGAEREPALALFEALALEPSECVLCSHGDVLSALIDRLLAVPTAYEGEPALPKAGLVVVDLAQGLPVTVRFEGKVRGRPSGGSSGVSLRR